MTEIERLLERGDLTGAMGVVEGLLSLDAARPELWRQRSLIAYALGRSEAALESMARATALAPHDAALWADYGALLHVHDRLGEAEQVLQHAHRLAPDDARILLRLAAVLLATERAESAAGLARRAVRLLPNSADAWHVLGDCARALGDHGLALQSFERAAALAPDRAELHYNLGLAEIATEHLTRAVASLRRCLALDGKFYPALAHLLYTQRRLADWTELAELSHAARELVRLGIPGITPFSFLAEPASAAEQHQCATLHARGVAQAAVKLPRPVGRSAPGVGPVRLGLVSNGFGEHPTGLLVVELVERLAAADDVDLTLFATAPPDGGPIQRRLAAAAEWIDLRGQAFGAMAERIAAAAIEVLVDLRGYGGGAVSEVFALRPAPIQINWLAYPGTSAAPWIDYCLADRVVLPDALRPYFSEAIVRLPICFQPCDTTRVLPAAPTRTLLGLPERGPVLASFNNGYKFSPQCLTRWFDILRALPDAVLWLLRTGEGEVLARNLAGHAARAGIDPERLRFLPKQPHAHYLACLSRADLFLDTWPYGAHTTAADALYAGLPVLTWAGETFASRVATSLLAHAGLDESIARDPDDYVARAIAQVEPEANARLRQRLAHARATGRLFDMARYTRCFRRAITTIAERHRRGLPPADVDLPED